MVNEVSDHAHEAVIMRNVLKVYNLTLYWYMLSMIAKKQYQIKKLTAFLTNHRVIYGCECP